MMNEKIYTIAQIMELLSISKGTAYRLLHSGEIKFFRIGRSIRVTETELQNYIKSHSGRVE